MSRGKCRREEAVSLQLSAFSAGHGVLQREGNWKWKVVSLDYTVLFRAGFKPTPTIV